MVDNGNLTILGSTVRHAIDHVECFPAPPDVTSIRFVNDELNSMCPVTQQPDLSTVVIEYVPDAWCVESKSLKLYLWGFRDRAVFDLAPWNLLYAAVATPYGSSSGSCSSRCGARCTSSPSIA